MGVSDSVGEIACAGLLTTLWLELWVGLAVGRDGDVRLEAVEIRVKPIKYLCLSLIVRTWFFVQPR